MSILNTRELSQISPPFAPIYGALANARREFADIPKNRVATIKMRSGGSYHYKYADLADVFAATTPALSANGLAIMQYPDNVHIVTVLTHESGVSKEFLWPIKPMPQRELSDAQSFQSAVQVAKRYALTAVLGISTEETIEGDAKGHRVIEGNGQPKDPFFTDDGIRAPIGAKITSDMSKDAAAKEAARAIEALLKEAKTEKGLEGVWSRNERFITVFKGKYDALFQDVYDVYDACRDNLSGEAE